MQPKTLFEKIWARNVVCQEDTESLLYIDRCVIHEGSNHSFYALSKKGIPVARPKQIFAFADHYLPTKNREAGLEGIADPEIRNIIVELDRNTAATGIAKFGLGDEAQGILHVAGPELGITQP